MYIEGLGKPAGCKLIRLRGELEEGVIRSLAIRGDFFASPEEGFDRIEARLRGIPPGELAAAFDTLAAEEGVELFGISGAGVAEVFAASCGEEQCL